MTQQIKTSRKYFLIALIMFCAQISNAHPVSFKNGFGIMSYNSAEMNELLLTYSFSPKVAAAFTFLGDTESEFYIPRANFLLFRANNEDSQGNIYLSLGAGTEVYKQDETDVSLMHFVADWESRKYYTYFEHTYINRDNNDNALLENKDYNHSKLRLGFAPFLADYTDLNVWWIAQFDKKNLEDQVTPSQYLRFYIRNVLWEIGSDFDGHLAFNLMVHI